MCFIVACNDVQSNIQTIDIECVALLQCVVPGGNAHTATRFTQIAGIRTAVPTEYQAVVPTSFTVMFGILPEFIVTTVELNWGRR